MYATLRKELSSTKSKCDNYLRYALFFRVFVSQVCQVGVCGPENIKIIICLLIVNYWPADAMAMTMTAAMLMEKAESDQVDDQPHGAHPQNQLGVVDGLGLVEPLQALDSDGETERN